MAARVDLKPDSPYALSMLAYTRQHRCDWRGLSELHARINRLLEANEPTAQDGVNPFNILAMPTSAIAQLRAASAGREQSPRRARSPAPLRGRVAANACAWGSFLRISVRIRWCTVDRVLGGLRSRSIRDLRLRIAPEGSGSDRQRAARAFEHFTDVSAIRVAAIAQRIRADRIEILIDLNGYTKNARETIFALRPAPVQINCLGYPGTLGADWYDYISSIATAPPERSNRFFSRAVAVSCRTVVPERSRAPPAGPPPSRAECGLPSRASCSAASTTRTRSCPRYSPSGCGCCVRCRAACCGCSRPAPTRRATCAAKRGRPASRRRASSSRPRRPGAPCRATQPPISSSIPFPTARIRPPTMRCSPACRSSPAPARRWSAASRQPAARHRPAGARHPESPPTRRSRWISLNTAPSWLGFGAACRQPRDHTAVRHGPLYARLRGRRWSASGASTMSER